MLPTNKGIQPSSPDVGISANKSAIVTAAGISGGIIGTGFIRTKNGRLWDSYVNAVRNVETGFPAGILRTLRTSELLSPLESYKQYSFAPQYSSGHYANYLSRTFGNARSYTLTKTGAVFGEVTSDTGELLGYGFQIESGAHKGSALADYYARIKGVPLEATQSLNDSILIEEWRKSRSPLGYFEWLKTMQPWELRRRIILGAKLRNEINLFGHNLKLGQDASRRLAKFEALTNLARAKAAADVGRLNTLLSAPLEIPVVGKFLSKIPGYKNMMVRPGTVSQMIGRLAFKGALVGAGFHGLEYIDYLRSQGSPMAPVLSTVGGAALGGLLLKNPAKLFSKAGLIAGGLIGAAVGLAPRFDKGIFYGAASTYGDVSLAHAELANQTGLAQSLREQEEVTPGLATRSTAIGMGLTGSLIGGFAGYSGLLKEAIFNKEPGEKFFQAVERIRARDSLPLLEKYFPKALENVPVLNKLKNIKSPMALGFLGGLAVWQGATSILSLMSGNPLAAIPGAALLGTTETPEHLQKIYSGEEEIAVRKGRWWEAGRSSPYSGGRVDYYRTHFLPRLRSRAALKGLYGSEEERWQYDPMLHPVDALFGSDDWKYHYEQKYQYERPAPVTGTYFEDVPFIGPALAATFGKLIKPRKLVRPEEWNLGNKEYTSEVDVMGESTPAYHLGGLSEGAPVIPDEPTQLLNELNYRRREMIGLPGFLEGAITKGFLGREEFLPNLKTLESMGKETGSEYWLWKHLNLGGAAGSSESIRRFIPHTRNYLESYNPLKSNLPSWIPDDYFMDLKTGNPYKKIAEAEIRLPGPGYAALHPEVQGLNPEDYPLAHRVKILGDIAYYSDEYRSAMRKAKNRFDDLSPEEQRIIRVTEQQVREKKKRREFNEYRFNPDAITTEDVTVTEVLSPTRFRTKEYGSAILETAGVGSILDKEGAMSFAQDSLLGRQISFAMPTNESRRWSKVSEGPRIKGVPMIDGTPMSSLMAEQGLIESEPLKDEFEQLQFSKLQQTAGHLSEKLLHSLNSPLESMTPLSPASKFIRQRSALEDYYMSRVSTDNAFWDRPYENFIKPTLDMMSYKMGADAIPKETKERRDIEEYFDMLQWTKYSRLEAQARQSGDLNLASEFLKEKSKTTFGSDVYKSPVSAMLAIPRQERGYFDEFVNAQTEAERAAILKLVPESQKRIYTAQWARQAERAAFARKEAGIERKEDQNIIEAVALSRMSEGFSFQKEDVKEWANATGGDVTFDDWMRERKADDYFEHNPLPDSDSLIWNPAVDLDDVKMKYVETLGKDFHDFDLWEQRKQSLELKPYINDELINELMHSSADYIDSWEISNKPRTLTRAHGDKDASIQYMQSSTSKGGTEYNINVKDGRKNLIDKAYKMIGV